MSKDELHALIERVAQSDHVLGALLHAMLDACVPDAPAQEETPHGN